MELKDWLPPRLRVALASARESLSVVRDGLSGALRRVVDAPRAGEEPAGPQTIEERAGAAGEGAQGRPEGPLRAVFRDLRVVEVVRQTEQAVSLWLDNSGPDPIRFNPGQFLTLLVSVEGQKERRAYSLCSDPAEPDRVAVTVKRVPGGRVSGWINDNVRAGDVIRTLGPSGRFGLDVRPNARRRLVLVAAGAGITPLFSILQAVTASEPASRVALVYGNRRWEDVIFADELERLARERDRLTVRHVLTRPPGNWAGHRGRLVGRTLEAALPLDRRAHYYVCGPEGMMRAVTEHLAAAGVPGTRVHLERFVPQGGGAATAGAGEIHTVRFRRSGAVLRVADTRTLLDAGLSAGLALPSSCRMGGCGACRQRVLSGEVVMEQPNCLTERERARGLRLLCVGRPSGPLEIDA